MLHLKVIDIETTGLEPDEGAEIVELGSVDLFCDEQQGYKTTGYHTKELVVKPTKPIPPEMSAIHHILDEDVVNAPGEAIALEGFRHVLSDEVSSFYVAHNAKFEQKFLTKEKGFTDPWICTYKVAMKLYPDAAGHSNQALRYILGAEGKVKIPREVGMPHRALPDCVVTAGLVEHFLTLVSPEEMVRISSMPTLQKKIRFGKHVDTLWIDAPRDYLRWIVQNGTFDEDVDYTARYYLGMIKDA